MKIHLKAYLKANKIKFNKTDKFKVKELIKKIKKLLAGQRHKRKFTENI